MTEQCETSQREIAVRERAQLLMFAAHEALAELAQAQTWLSKDGADDLMAYRAIQRACEKLRRGMDAATGHGG